MKELWKPIRGYEGLYEVSNYGRIFSKPRTVKNSGCLHSTKMVIAGRILKTLANTNGYHTVRLHKKGVAKTRTVHSYVWDAFGDRPRNGHKLQVDHIDNNRQNNRIDNLQLLTNRENHNKGVQKNKKSRLPLGVKYVAKGNKRYTSRIKIGKKCIGLGFYKTPREASKAYQNKLKEIKDE